MPKILMIDDDSDYTAALKGLLEAHSYSVAWAADSAAGMEMIKADPPDMILLDIMMTTMGEGLHMAYKLKSDPEYAQIPILMLTSIAQRTGLKFDPEDDGEFIPVEAYMDKSTPPDVLCSKIARILKQRRPKK